MQIFQLLLPLLFVCNLFAYPNYSDAIKVKKIYPMGERIYQKRCHTINVKQYKEYNTLLEAIQKGVCKELSPRYQEALALYLWDHKDQKLTRKHYPSLSVNHTQKCPVCGMFLYKYPRWVSMIEYKNGKKFYFDGLKDMFKYYFEHPQNIKGMFTRDYYTQETIAVRDAYLVLGSNVYGPMGNEFIAFSTQKSAQHFLFDHKAKKIVRLNDITKKMVYKLDE